MATPSPSPSPPPPQSPPSSTKKPQPVPWSHQETLDLVRAYQQKWYSLKRGPLRSGQWDQLSSEFVPTKTPTQCRHKIEKLRRRFRSEKLRPGPSQWPYFGLMESLELGPVPISARPMSQVRYNDHYHNDHYHNDHDQEQEYGIDIDNNDNGDDGGDDDEDDGFSKSRSINYILRKPTVVNRFAPAVSGARRLERIGEREREEERGDSLASRIAVEIRGFSERMVGVERMRMEATREMERFRVEMENRRMGMILESQKRIAEAITRAFEDDEEEDE